MTYTLCLNCFAAGLCLAASATGGYLGALNFVLAVVNAAMALGTLRKSSR